MFKLKEDFHHLGSIKILPKGLDLENNYETAERHYRHMDITWEQYNAIRVKSPDVIYHIIDKNKDVLGDNEIPGPDSEYPKIAICGPDEHGMYIMIDISYPSHIIPLMKFDQPVDAMHVMQLYNIRTKESKRYQQVESIINFIAEQPGKQIYQMIIGLIGMKYRDNLALQKFYEIVSNFNRLEQCHENLGILYVQKLMRYLNKHQHEYIGNVYVIIDKFIIISESILNLLQRIRRLERNEPKYMDLIKSCITNVYRIL